MIMKKLLAICLLSACSLSVVQASLTPEERTRNLVKDDTGIPRALMLKNDAHFDLYVERQLATTLVDIDVDLVCLGAAPDQYSFRTWLEAEIGGWQKLQNDPKDSIKATANKNVERLKRIQALLPAKSAGKPKKKKSSAPFKSNESDESGSFLRTLRKNWKAISMVTAGFTILAAAGFFGWQQHNKGKKAPVRTK